MKAEEAKVRTEEYNNLKIPVRDTIKAIQHQTKLGNFSLRSKFDTSDIAYGVQGKLEELGYVVMLSSKQISPEDSDYFLHISWDV